MNPVDPSLGDRAKDARGVIGKSFEFALGHVGQDRRAGDMWMEYIAFLKEGQVRLFVRWLLPSGADKGRAESRNVGGSAAHGRAPQGVSASSSDPTQQRRADLARIQPVREQHEQDDRASSPFSSFAFLH